MLWCLYDAEDGKEAADGSEGGDLGKELVSPVLLWVWRCAGWTQRLEDYGRYEPVVVYD